VEGGDTQAIAPEEMQEGRVTTAMQYEPSASRGGRALPSRELSVDVGQGAPRVLSLAVVVEPFRKPYYGGFRHRLTGVEYHHAVCQTEAPPKPVQAADAATLPKFHRETQTKKVQERAQQAVREYGTQMEREGVATETRTDYAIEPRAYVDAAEFARRKAAAALVIQCYARGMFARSLARQSRYEMAYNEQAFLEHQAREAQERAELREREIERRMHPRTAADFETLYEELEQWRLAETRKIEVAETDAAEKQKARYELLLKEVKLVQTIDRLKAGARHKNRAEGIARRLSKMSEPQLWEMGDGTLREVQTPATARAKELADLYHGLTRPHLRVDERLDVLLHVKWTVREFEQLRVCRDLAELIDREADLLNRGRSERALEGLRKRIARAFLEFTEDPRCNPGAAGAGTQQLHPLVLGQSAGAVSIASSG